MWEGERYRQLFFPFSVINSFSMKTTRKIYILILQVSPCFHYDRTNNKEKVWVYGHDNKSWWHSVCIKFALLKCVRFIISKETSAHSFWATRLIWVLKEADWSALQNCREFFFIDFRNLKKSYNFCKLKISMKKLLF